MFHELKVSNDGNMFATADVCRSRIRLFHVKVGEDPVEIFAPDTEWDLRSVEGAPATCYGSAGQFLDHPFMAVGPDNRVHIVWYRLKPEHDQHPLARTAGMFFRMLDGATETWEVNWREVASPPTPLGIPYIVVDPAGAASYHAWDGSSATGYRHLIYKCTLADCQPLPENPSDSIPHGSLGFFNFDGSRLRVPSWAYAITPSMGTAGRMHAIVYTSQAGHNDIRYTILTDGAQDWSQPEYLPDDDPTVERFGPNATMLGDNTVVVSFYQTTPPGNISDVKPMLAIRDPDSQRWRIESIAYDWTFDLGAAPHKPGQSKGDGFIGDYNTFTGGVTHVHYMRMAPQTAGNWSPLRTAAVSELCFHA